MCFASSGARARSGTRNTGSRTAARSRRGSARRGRRGRGRGSATSPGGAPRSGCARGSTRRASAPTPARKRTDATFAEAAREWLRYVEHDRACKPSTLRSYRSTLEAHLLPAFGELALHEITPAHIERWRAGLTGSPRTKNKLLTELYGVVRRAQKVYGLEGNPAAQVEKLRQRRRLDLDVFTPEEVRALCRAAGSEEDAALYLTAAFTGLRRGELIALRWRDVDFAASRIRVSSSFAGGRLTAPKSGKVRSVPLARDVACVLAQLGQRERWTADDDVVFPGRLGGYLDGSALRRR
jgi:integrase